MGRHRLFLVHSGRIFGDYLPRITHTMHNAILKPQDPVATLGKKFKTMRDNQSRPGFRKLINKGFAFFLKNLVADRKRFIHDQHISLGENTNSEGQSSNHAHGIGAHRLLEGWTNFSEPCDLLDTGINFSVRQTKYRSPDPRVITPSKKDIEPRT